MTFIGSDEEDVVEVDEDVDLETFGRCVRIDNNQEGASHVNNCEWPRNDNDEDNEDDWLRRDFPI